MMDAGIRCSSLHLALSLITLTIDDREGMSSSIGIAIGLLLSPILIITTCTTKEYTKITISHSDRWKQARWGEAPGVPVAAHARGISLPTR